MENEMTYNGRAVSAGDIRVIEQQWADARIYVLINDGGVAMLEVASEPIDRGLFCNLWVEVPMRGKGYGGALLERAEAIAAAEGLEMIFLKHDSRDTADWVKGWYERRGYSVGRECGSVEWMFKDLKPERR